MISYKQTCREELLKVLKELVIKNGRNEFTIVEAIDEMHKNGSFYKESTIRTHIVSKCRVDAPVHHSVTFDDYVRLGKGKYALHQNPLK